MKKIFFILLIVLVSSCTEEYGHKVTGGNLTVYFVDKSDGDLASEVAYFYKENDLIASEPHDLRLEKYKDGYRLCLIARDTEEVKHMQFAERKALQDLQNGLQEKVFKDKKIEIIITDNQFKPILNINK